MANFVYSPAVSIIRQATCLDDVLKNLVLFERNKELECLLKRCAYAHLEFVFIYEEEAYNVSLRQ
ncbi:hypothetical protein [Pasteurella multocida]|uniref:hypothetical protein n=1 Tax=Pasteurella multocida TaxID=747 RepID=UPI001D11B885|nr:hypothetical protein [Pasteurella multocida]